MNIALFGGAFDPIHNGHLALARGLAAALSVDRVLLMPAGLSPHKPKLTATTGENRLQMCRLAVKGDALFTVCDDEIQRGGASFTVDTLERLHERYPEDTLFLFTGSDMFLTLSSWKGIERIASLATLCTVPRSGECMDRLIAYAERLKARFGARCEVRELEVMRVSSTEVRASAAAGRPLSGWVPCAVESYIRDHGLYRKGEGGVNRDEQFQAIVRERLNDKRYRHSLEVAKEAQRLAVRYGADEAKAYTAGLLHDIMKNTEEKAQLQILSDFGILLDNVEAVSPKLWHARTGAVFIEKMLGVDDPDILLAVRYHTTARAGMGLLEKVLYLADFTSADRDYDDVDTMRRLVDEDMEKAMLYALRYTIRELLDGGHAIHPDTLNAYNEIILHMKKGVDDHGKGQAQ